MGRWVRMNPATLAMICLVGLTGCHAVSKTYRPSELKPGHGRVDRPLAVAIGPALRASMAVLDEHKVQPKQLMIQSLAEGPGQPGSLGIEPEVSNSAMVPTGAKFDDLFLHHQVTKPDGSAVGFVPRFVTYTGATSEGRSVLVTIATRRDDEANNLITVRVGANGDEAWSQAFLDQVSARVGGGSGQVAPAPPNPTLPN